MSSVFVIPMDSLLFWFENKNLIKRLLQKCLRSFIKSCIYFCTIKISQTSFSNYCQRLGWPSSRGTLILRFNKLVEVIIMQALLWPPGIIDTHTCYNKTSFSVRRVDRKIIWNTRTTYTCCNSNEIKLKIAVLPKSPDLSHILLDLLVSSIMTDEVSFWTVRLYL